MRDKLFINGEWVAPENNATFPVINPATEEVFHNAPAGSANDVDKAVKAASVAFKGPWSKTTGKERAVYLRKMADGMERDLRKLSELEVMDNGKPYPEAEWDIEDAIGCFRYYANLAEELDDKKENTELGDDRFKSEVRYSPIGVAALITPWNYPMLMASWKIAPAIAAGATCVLKPATVTPMTALEYGGYAQEAGLPAGVLNIVTGLGSVIGDPLTQHKLVNKVAFTGSVPIGSRIMSMCAQDIKNVSLELGGKSPVIVFDDADIEGAVEWVMFGIFWNQGQVCSGTSRLLVQEGIRDKFLKRLKEETEKITIGDGMTEGTLLGPLVSAGQMRDVLSFIDHGIETGVTMLTGGRCDDFAKGYYVKPTIFVDPPLDDKLWTDEIFGPVLAVRSFGTEEEGIELANDSIFGLAAAIMSTDKDRCSRVADAMHAGIIWVNCSQPTFTEAPWGGYKQSGFGRELGRWGMYNYLETKQVTEFISPKPWGWYMK
ncbi:aldehyde dehydrogenase family protein [Dasania marina]|uniref:aldehyde dehydrogenase family protein n=1 Tax=Dasania marina TaxID=471499 RepID=UPI00035E13C1|nr:aldehyde dehydrogenase family protein [Dasania marina]